MLRKLVLVGLTACPLFVQATEQAIALDESQWMFIGSVSTVDYLDQKALLLGAAAEGEPLGFGAVVLKNVGLENGVIEYDMAFPEAKTFAGINFRTQSEGNEESFYFRAHHSKEPDATQYMPMYNGVDSWQLYNGEQYSTPSEFVFDQWMPVKLVIAGEVADMYIRDLETPALTMPLERDPATGGIAFWGMSFGGDVKIANVRVTPMSEAPDLKGTLTPLEPAAAGTVMSWMVSDAFDGQTLAGKTMLSDEELAQRSYTKLAADITGMTNLAKVQAPAEGQDTVFAKTTIESDAEQIKALEFGFSDHVSVYLNGQLLFHGKDLRNSRDYRFLGTVGYYDTVYLPLKAGSNEVLFAISELVSDPTGWGVQARLTNLDGVTIK